MIETLSETLLSPRSESEGVQSIEALDGDMVEVGAVSETKGGPFGSTLDVGNGWQLWG